MLYEHAFSSLKELSGAKENKERWTEKKTVESKLVRVMFSELIFLLAFGVKLSKQLAISSAVVHLRWSLKWPVMRHLLTCHKLWFLTFIVWIWCICSYFRYYVDFHTRARKTCFFVIDVILQTIERIHTWELVPHSQDWRVMSEVDIRSQIPHTWYNGNTQSSMICERVLPSRRTELWGDI